MLEKRRHSRGFWRRYKILLMMESLLKDRIIPKNGELKAEVLSECLCLNSVSLVNWGFGSANLTSQVEGWKG